MVVLLSEVEAKIKVKAAKEAGYGCLPAIIITQPAKADPLLQHHLKKRRGHKHPTYLPQ